MDNAGDIEEQRAEGLEAKPHGRLAWTIPLGHGHYVDLSVMPRA